jgi:hypothetical protein
MIEIFLASLLIGVLAGISAGLFGIGGGALIVPTLAWLFELHQFNPEQILLMAVASSLATALPTSISSLRTHHKLNNIIWHRAFRLMPTLLLASICGAILAEFISAELLRWFFVCYLLYTSLRLAWPKSSATSGHPRLYLDYPMGFLIGSISAILGIGGGTITVPYLVSSGLQIKNAVATSSACALPIAISAAISYIVLGWHTENLPEGSFGYVYLPAFWGITTTSVFTAPIGARLAHRLPAIKLKRYFALVLLFMAIKMAN